MKKPSRAVELLPLDEDEENKILKFAGAGDVPAAEKEARAKRSRAMKMLKPKKSSASDLSVEDSDPEAGRLNVRIGSDRKKRFVVWCVQNSRGPGEVIAELVEDLLKKK